MHWYKQSILVHEYNYLYVFLSHLFPNKELGDLQEKIWQTYVMKTSMELEKSKPQKGSENIYANNKTNIGTIISIRFGLSILAATSKREMG